MPIRHLHISSTWGAQLAELLDGVLPAVSEHLETLDLSVCNLGSWPQGLRRCTQLRGLTLSGNILLGNPPNWLAELTNLRTLTLDKIGMSQLPSECVALQHLKSLSLADNQLVQPPLWLYRLPELRQLHLENNRFYQPWEEMLLPVLQSCPRRSSTISLESLVPSQSGPSTPTSTSAPFTRPALAVSQKPALPASPSVSIAEPPKSSKSSSASSSKAPGEAPQPPKSTLGQRWTAMLKRNKTLRSKSVPASLANSPVPSRVPTTASLPDPKPSPASGSVPFAVPVRSISGPAYDEVPTSNGSSSPSSAPLELDQAVGPFDPGWPNLHAGSEDKVESSISVEETHARRVRAVQRYLQDLNDLCSTFTPSSTTLSTGTMSSAPVSVTAPLSAPVPSTTNLQVNQHVALLQQGARNDPQRRKRVVTELIESEQRYVAGLESLVEVYVKPCKDLVPPAQHKLVFSNVESLLHFHKASFFPALRQAANVLLAPSVTGATEEQRSLEAGQAVAKVFVDLASFFRMYASYINNCDVAQQVVMSWGTLAPPTVGGHKRTLGPTLRRPSNIRGTRSSSASAPQPHPHLQPTGSDHGGPGMSSQDRKALQRHLKKAASDPRSSALGLESYLLLPVQRIPRYRLLLEDLVRCVPLSSEGGMHHPDQVLAMALSAVLKVAKSMNEAKRHAEQELRLCTWQTYLSQHRIAILGDLELVAPHRRLLKEGIVTLLRIVRPGQVYARIAPSIPAPSENALGLSRSKTISAPRRPPRNSARIQVLHQDMVGEKVTMLLCNDLVLLVSNTRLFASPSAEPPAVKAVTNLKSRDQLGTDGPTICLRDNQSIYYLSTMSDADAQEWASTLDLLRTD